MSEEPEFPRVEDLISIEVDTVDWPPLRFRDVVIRENREGVRLETGPEDILRVEGCRFREVDLSDARLVGFAAEGVLFERCDFSRWRVGDLRFGLELEGSPYVMPVYRECRFDGASLRRRTDPQLARFERCSFKGAAIVDWLSMCAEFVDCDFRNAQISDSVFYGRPIGPYADRLTRQVNEFRGNDFQGATFRNTDFRLGIDLTLQRLPEGPEYLLVDRPAERLARARTLLEREPASGVRERALSLWAFFEEEKRDESAFFVCRDDFPAVPRESRELLWAALETAMR